MLNRRRSLPDALDNYDSSRSIDDGRRPMATAQEPEAERIAAVALKRCIEAAPTVWCTASAKTFFRLSEAAMAVGSFFESVSWGESLRLLVAGRRSSVDDTKPREPAVPPSTSTGDVKSRNDCVESASSDQPMQGAGKISRSDSPIVICFEAELLAATARHHTTFRDRPRDNIVAPGKHKTGDDREAPEVILIRRRLAEDLHNSACGTTSFNKNSGDNKNLAAIAIIFLPTEAKLVASHRRRANPTHKIAPVVLAMCDELRQDAAAGVVLIVDMDELISIARLVGYSGLGDNLCNKDVARPADGAPSSIQATSQPRASEVEFQKGTTGSSKTETTPMSPSSGIVLGSSRMSHQSDSGRRRTASNETHQGQGDGGRCHQESNGKKRCWRPRGSAEETYIENCAGHIARLADVLVVAVEGRLDAVAAPGEVDAEGCVWAVLTDGHMSSRFRWRGETSCNRSEEPSDHQRRQEENQMQHHQRRDVASTRMLTSGQGIPGLEQLRPRRQSPRELTKAASFQADVCAVVASIFASGSNNVASTYTEAECALLALHDVAEETMWRLML